ncbi:hypothetical protein RvY_08193 [Ramazzottius varieornatus]|uniref:F-box domain-containing protein n=1 Tax=Ramazzottius varieornatus TaxID=947166 RepID=A0A1D1V7Q3_RAMVA|nr:hypothetical protein RvY_08193 [Ramazzottius varieornatus]
MPKKRKPPSSKRNTPAKRPKTQSKRGDGNHKDAPEVDVGQSPFTVQDVFRLVPALILKEIFSYLDIPELSNLAKAFNRWKSMLIRTPARNKGIAFLDNPTFAEHRWVRFDSVEWSKAYPIPQESILHLVVVGKTSRYHHYYFIDPSTTQSACWPRKITYARNSFEASEDWRTFLEASVSSVDVVDSTIKFGPYLMPCNPELHFWKSYWSTLRRSSRVTAEDGWYALADIVWHIKIRVKSVVIPRIASEEESRAYVHKERDKQKLFWPFPEEQLEWLMISLANLDQETQEAVRDADALWRKYRQCLNEQDLTTWATHEKRKLTSLDLAFFGRLLVSLNNVKPSADFQPPPFPFPNDFKFHLTKRKGDCGR